MTDWLCVEYDGRGKELTRYVVKDMPPGAYVWHMPKHPKGRVVKCSTGGDLSR